MVYELYVMNQEPVIRKARSEDLPTLLQFEQGVIEAERPFDQTLKRSHTNYYDLHGMIDDPNVHLVVVMMENNIIGSGYARIQKAKNYLQHHEYAYLGFMYVLPECRGMGINSKVILALKEWSFSRGVYEIRLEVYIKNKSAIRAYEKMGFEMNMVEMRMKMY
jgi:ribosomal protein S18 acetylase RimI-like enzyme